MTDTDLTLEQLQSRGVLLVTQQLRTVRSGVGTYARTVVAGLLARNIPMTIATWDDECDSARFEGVTWWKTGSRPKLDPTPGSFYTLGRRTAQRLRTEARPFAVVHFLDAREGHAVLADRDTRGLVDRLVGTVHDDYAVGAPRGLFGLRRQAADPLRRWAYYRWLRGLEQQTLPRFDALATNARATGESIVRGYGIDQGRCSVVPLTIEAVPYAVLPASLEGSPTLLFVGGNFFRKGLDAVIDALPTLHEAHPELTLHVAGQDPARGVLEQRAIKLGVETAVVWHDRVDTQRCVEMFAAADALVVPSRTEALGLVYLEAFAAGVPVVAGLKGGVNDIVRDGESGLQVPTIGDDVAAAVSRLLTDRELADRLRTGGRSILAERTVEALVDQTLATYLGSPPPHPASAPTNQERNSETADAR